MAGTDLETVASKKALEKQKDTKPKMSYLEALDAIQKYDVAVKEAAKIRIDDTIHADFDVCNYSAKKMGLASLGVVASLIISPAVGMELTDHVSVTGAVTIGSCIATIVTWWVAPIAKFISPFKFKKLSEEEKSEQYLIELKEQEFNQVADEILKKAKKARKVIDRHLIAQNKFSEYKGDKGREGFKISEIKHLNDWEKEKLRVQYSSPKQVLEIESQKPVVKELGISGSGQKELEKPSVG